MNRRSLLKLLGVVGIAPAVSKAEDASCSQLEFDSKVTAVTDLSLLPRNAVDHQVVNVWGYGDFIYRELHSCWLQL